MLAPHQTSPPLPRCRKRLTEPPAAARLQPAIRPARPCATGNHRRGRPNLLSLLATPTIVVAGVLSPTATVFITAVGVAISAVYVPLGASTVASNSIL